jgi:hypothetical protein
MVDISIARGRSARLAFSLIPIRPFNNSRADEAAPDTRT